MDFESKTPETQPLRLPSIWLTVLIAIIILLAIFIPYRKKLNRYSLPVIHAIQAIAKTNDVLPEASFGISE